MDPADQFHSPYTYVGNDPVNLVDPNGMQSTWCGDRSSSCSGSSGGWGALIPSTTELLSKGNSTLSAGMSITSLHLGASKAKEYIGNSGGGKTLTGDLLTSSRTSSMSAEGYPNTNARAGYSIRYSRVARAAKLASKAGAVATVAGLFQKGWDAYQNPDVIQRPGYAAEVAFGVGSLFSGPVAVAGVVYMGADWYCSGKSQGGCGTFNYVTDTPYPELYQDLRE